MLPGSTEASLDCQQQQHWGSGAAQLYVLWPCEVEAVWQCDWAVRYPVCFIFILKKSVRFPWKRSWCAAWWFFGCCGQDSAQACYLIYAGAVHDIFIKCLLGGLSFYWHLLEVSYVLFFITQYLNKVLNKICSHNKVNYSATRWWSWRVMAGPSLSTLTRSLVG